MKRWIAIWLCVGVIFAVFGTYVQAQVEEVVSLGADLNQQQQKQMLELFGVAEDDVKIIKVTNQEERDYLEGLVSNDKIGTRAISSAYVSPLEEGEGLVVETHNISWVTKEMYANAMATAGIENARVIAAAPFSVSGTAALTGIMKAFEEVSGEELDEEAKKIANEELVTTGDLGEDIGKDEAAALIKEIKERIVRERIKDPEDIKRIILEIAKELNIQLTEEQINQIIELMKKISQLDLDIDKITNQLEKITKSLDSIRKTVEENKGILQRIWEGIQSFLKWIVSLFE
ncbi:MAG: DUF1002 domain-containing protein [Clostridiales bacterium]|nr:DUF1002 domain-containing protein [Clostridiales bacterium]